MMTQAFYSGISGLKTYSAGIDVVSDNLANTNTTGFRGYNVEFASMFEESLASASSGIVDSSIGLGSRVQTTSMIQTNGSLLLSDKSTDLAIDGDGWFGVQGEERPIYTRDGNFTFDANDDLVTADGLHVLGTMGNNISNDDVLTSKLNDIALGDVNAQEKLRFPKSLSYPVEPTTNAKFLANVGTEFDIIAMGATVIDNQSNKNDLRLEFTQNPVQTPPGTQWSVTATTQSLDGTIIYDTQTGSVEFDEAGALASHTLTTIDNNGTPVTIDLGSGYDGVVSISTTVVPGSSIADGTLGGELVGYAINKNAEVIATFTNGKQSSVGKIAVFHFQNDQGLDRLSGSRFQESSNSGSPIFFTDENGQIIGAEVVNFKLEGSNYAMTSGLTELIIYQRAYDANSKSITTADEMMQKALSMDA
ncbi:MAG: flagellar hook-basal body complex protein [Campylobacterota bacterium]|nr:flagellar hook-basal body complex protein [Campylobacterota bacterium]